MDSVEQNKTLARRYMEAVWQGENVDKEYHASNTVIHTPASASGVQNMAQTAAYFRSALPDLAFDNSAVFGQEDRVFQRYTVTGTHTGAPLFNFPASGHELSLAGVNIYRFKAGKIVEQWSIIDAADVFQQLQQISAAK